MECNLDAAFKVIPECSARLPEATLCPCLRRELDIIEAPLFDLEVRGVPALQYFGGRVWDSQQEH